MIGYKVVKQFDSNSKLYSCRMSTRNMGLRLYSETRSKYQAIYIPNEFIYPGINGAKLFFFNNFYAAQEFYRSDTEQIWTCEALNAGKVKYICNNMENIDDFWLTKSQGKKLDKARIDSAPTGTYAASAIKLLERVDKNA